MKCNDTPALGNLTSDEALRKQCLIWAFQTRDLMDAPHMQVVNVAEVYYRFIRPGATDEQTSFERFKSWVLKPGAVYPRGTVQPGVLCDPVAPARAASVPAPKPKP